VAFRIANFAAEITDAVPSVISVKDPLKRQDYCREQRETMRYRCCRCCGAGRSIKKGDENESCEREHFEQARNVLREAAPANSSPLKQSKKDRDGESNRYRMTRERRNQDAGIFSHDHGNDCDRCARGHPIAPPNDKAGIVAERAMCENIKASGARNHRAQLSN